MRQIFTLLAGCMFFMNIHITAQTILLQDFESATIPDLPAGWVSMGEADTGWRTHNGAIPSVQGWEIPEHTDFAVLDDWNHNEKNRPSKLITPIFSLKNATGVFYRFDFYFIGAGYTGTTIREAAYIQASTDGGTTWNTIDTIVGGETNAWVTDSIFSLSTLEGKDTVQLAFVYYDGGDSAKQLIGFGVDNIEVFSPLPYDVAIDAVSLPYLHDTVNAGANGSPVKFSFTNKGSTAVTSLDVQYTVNGGTPVTQTFTGLNLPSFKSANLTFATALSGVTKGTNYTVVVTANKVNAVNDTNAINNSKSANFLGMAQALTKPCFIEDFTSGTWEPSAEYHAVFDPVIEAAGVNKPASNFNIIRYQMAWGGSFDDPSFNEHCDMRSQFYQLNPRLPLQMIHGKARTTSMVLADQILTQAGIDDCKGGLSAFAKAEGTYYTNADSAWVDVSVTPLFTADREYKLLIAMVERDYWYGDASSGQTHFFHVQRKMFPDGDGVAVSGLTENKPVTYKKAVKLKIGKVEQYTDNLWSHPINTTLVVFLQDAESQDVMQSVAIPAQWPTNVENASSAITTLSVYPNPATDKTTIGISLDKATTVDIQVTDIIGKVIYTTSQKLEAGSNTLPINTTNFANGSYNITIKAENTHIVKHLSVIK